MLTDAATEPHDEHRLRPITGFLLATFPPKRAGRREAWSLQPLRTSQRPESPRSRRRLPTLISTSAEDSLICIFEVLPDEFLKLGQALKPIPASLSGSSRPAPRTRRTRAGRRSSPACVGIRSRCLRAAAAAPRVILWGPHHCCDAFRDRRKRRRSGFKNAARLIGGGGARERVASGSDDVSG